MGRIRTIKPELLSDEKVGSLSHAAFRLMVGMLVMADDSGRLPAAPGLLAGQVFWGAPADVPACLDELARAGVIQLYRVRGQAFALICNFLKHQKINRPSGPKYPGPDQTDEPSGSPQGGLTESSPSRQTGHSGPSEASSATARPPEEPPLGKPADSRDSLSPHGALYADRDRYHDRDRDREHEGEHEGEALAAGPPAAPAKRARARKAKPSAPSPEEMGIIERVLERLSARSGVAYGAAHPDGRLKGNARYVLARLRDGVSEDALRAIVWHFGNEWAENERMDQYLQPSTLFGPEKFDQRLDQALAAERKHEAKRARALPQATQPGFALRLMGDGREG